MCCQYFVTVFDLWSEQVCDALMHIARTCSSDASRLNGCVLVWRHVMLLRDVWWCVKLHVWLCVKLHLHFDAQLQALYDCCALQYSAHA